MAKTLEEIERSIIKTYRKDIWRPFTKVINEFQLIQDGDKIGVCISGGKDSMLLAKCFQELQKHKRIYFELEFIVMDPGYNEWNLQKIQDNAKQLNLPIQRFPVNIYDYVFGLNEGSPCYLCAKMRRGHLYSIAQKLGCNKIALGHHYDDVLETILMNLFFAGMVRTMMPKLRSQNFERMELIRPFYYVREERIRAFAKRNDLTFINCACRFTEKNGCRVDPEHSKSKRMQMKWLLGQLREKYPELEASLFRSVQNVDLNAVIAYFDESGKHHFLDQE